MLKSNKLLTDDEIANLLAELSDEYPSDVVREGGSNYLSCNNFIQEESKRSVRNRNVAERVAFQQPETTSKRK